MTTRESAALVFYVEDDENIRDLTLYALRQAGFEGRGFPDADAFFAACADDVPALVLLDIMLPGTDGLGILARLRADTRLCDVPVIMLTAKGTELDTISGLDAGADDYLAKPFSMMELISRANALLRRARRSSVPMRGGGLVCGSIVLDPHARKVEVGGNPVDLTFKEFELLKAVSYTHLDVYKRQAMVLSSLSFGLSSTFLPCQSFSRISCLGNKKGPRITEGLQGM